MATLLIGWPLKRSAIARLQQYANGTVPAPPGVEALVGAQCEVVLPAEPDRLCVYGTAVSSTRRETSAEGTTSVETVTLELRVRVYAPGEADDDVGDVDRATGDLCQAVAAALLDYEPIIAPGLGSMFLQRVVQWPTAVTPFPDPSATGMASLFFQADVVTS